MKFKIPINERKVEYNIENYISDNLRNINLINEEYFNDIQEYSKENFIKNKLIYVTLFQNYFQGLEIIFSLLASIVQAPYYYY